MGSGYSGKSAKNVMIIGQSNSVGQGEWANPEPPTPGVRMFGNDYRYKQAYEPTDSQFRQVDSVSQDGLDPGDTYAHSPWLKCGNKIVEGSKGKFGMINFVPCAKGGSVQWHPVPYNESWNSNGDAFDRDSVWGSANFRKRRVCGIKPPSAVVGWGHETSTETSWGGADLLGWTDVDTESTHMTHMRLLMNQVWDTWGTSVPIIWVQLGPSYQGSASPTGSLGTTTNSWERMGLARTEQFELYKEFHAAGKPFYLIPSFMYGSHDGIHVSRTGVDAVGEWAAKAIRAAWGETPTPTWVGPRPTGCTTLSGLGDTQVSFDADLAAPSPNNDGQWRVFGADGTDLLVSAVAYNAGGPIISHANAGANTPVTVTYGYSYRSSSDLTDHIVRSSGDQTPALAFRITAGDTITW